MDEWRHFPSYQLERRSDIFFALYLPEVLEAKLGVPMDVTIAAGKTTTVKIVYDSGVR